MATDAPALRIATRGSPLARWQAELVASRLGPMLGGRRCELIIVTTTADRRLDVPLSVIGGKGVFVKEVQAAVLDGRADVAVHSAKDLPAATPDGLVLAAVPERADRRDALVGGQLADLGPGATVATGSARRRAQLAWLRPDLMFTELRGAIGTRLERLDEGRFDALVMAVAALERLGLTGRIAERLTPEVMLPQVGQGALAVEARFDDEATRSLLAELDDPVEHRLLAAERAFLAELGGDCDLPAGASADLAPEAGSSGIRVEGMLASLDGHRLARMSAQDTDGERAGAEVAARLREAVGWS